MNPDRKIIILLVEDQAAISIAETSVLKRNGFDVVVAHNSSEAIKISQENPHLDLILMDIDLGKGMDGGEAARIILKDREIPIVFLSNHTEKEIIDKTEKITSYGYVLKDAGESVLIASIKMAFKLFKANQKIKNELKGHKRTEEALKTNENKINSIFRVAPIGIGVTSNRILIELNDYIYKMLGYSSEELIGKSARVLYPTQEEFEFVGTEKYKQIEQIGTGSVETKWKCKDGTIVDILLSSTPLNLKEISGGVTFTALDITQRKQTEELIKESEANLNSMINNRFESIWSIDKNFNYTILNDFFKESYLATFGIELKKGMNALSILMPELIEFWKPKYDKAMAGESVVFELTNMVEDELHYYEVSLDSIVSDEKVIGVSGLSVDITARKQAELILKNAAAEKEALHRELLHRVKNSFNQIKSILYFECEKLIDPQTIRILENLEMRVGTLAEMYSMLNASGVSELINLGQYLEQITKSLKESYVGDDEKIIVKSAFDEINISPKMASSVGLIVNEILTNSFKYAFPDNKKGTISISLKEINGAAEIEIADNGIGFPDNFNFEKSTGMGFQLINMLVQQIAGKLKVNSKKGTKFIFVFPLDE